MKVKLLKNLRSKIKYKFAEDGRCIVLYKRLGWIIDEKKIEKAILQILQLEFQDDRNTWLDWSWFSIYKEYEGKIIFRKFRKIK